MSISIVNGYVCTCSCDVAKAKKGEDPHPNLHPATDGKGKAGQGEGPGTTRDDPAVLFGGSLSAIRATANTAASDASLGATSPDRQISKPSVDLLA